MKPLLPGHSGNTTEPSRNALNTSQGTNENGSQNNPHPEAGLFDGQITQNSGPEDGHDNNYKKKRKVADYVNNNKNILPEERNNENNTSVSAYESLRCVIIGPSNVGKTYYMLKLPENFGNKRPFHIIAR